MKKIDHLALDGYALALFLAVLEEQSVTAAAARLGLTQSAVSHGLERLRSVVGDPLFVRSGRGIVSTAQARALAEPARDLMQRLRDFSRTPVFDPRQAELSLTIAANDLQRDLLLPHLLARIEQTVARVTLRVVPSDLPQADLLRENRCDLLISPLPPTGIDILQKRLLRDRYVVFYDFRARTAPVTLADYLGARHVTVIYPDNERLNFDKRVVAQGITRDIAVSVPNFAGISAFLRGSRMLATLPALLAHNVMRGFATAPIPIKRQLGDLPLYAAWHARNQKDAAHLWVRGMLFDVARQITGKGA